MKMLTKFIGRRALGFWIGILAALGGVQNADGQSVNPTYQSFSEGTRWLTLGKIQIKMLVEQSNLGGAEIEIGEITFPAGTKGSDHTHTKIEIFYILSGQFEHTVNGVLHLLEAGMVGLVRPGDMVKHGVKSDILVKALVIWVPGGGVDQLIHEYGFKSRPIE